MGTYFKPIYDSFLSKITDDMYMELTKEETEGMLQELLLSAIPHFEFPRVGMEFTQDDSGEYYFISDFTFEEVNILANSKGGIGNREYDYIFTKNNEVIYESGYSDKSNIVVKPLEPGLYKVECKVKDEAGSIAVKSLEGKVNDKGSIIFDKVNTDIASPQLTNTSINLSVIAYSDESLQYRFVVLKDGVNVYTRGYKDSNKATWIAKESGEYTIYYKVKNASGNEFVKTKNYVIYEPGEIVVTNCSVNNEESLVSGKEIELGIEAYSNEELKYRFVVLKDGVNVYTRGYKETNKTVWIPKESGIYTIFYKTQNTSGKEVVKTKTVEVI